MGWPRLRVVALLSLSFVVVGSLFFTFVGSAQVPTPDTDLSAANASFRGEDAGGFSGYSVAPAGDVNGDGYDDFLIGAWGDGDGGIMTGQTYLILGKATGWAMDTDLSLANASFWGEGLLDYSGYSVAAAGDVNGDGYDDFLIGAYGDDDSGSYAGQTYLVLGKATGWAMDTNLSTADASFWGEDAGDFSGYSVAPAGDVNGDGYDDFLIGAYGDDDGGADAGQTYLILGKATGWAMDTDLSTADASFWGEDANDNSGWSVAQAGDVNGDGYDDFLIGAYGNDDSDSYAGQTYLILGKVTGWSMDTKLSAANASFWGEDANDNSGYLVTSAGDVNADGYDDFLIGAWGSDDGGSNAGQTYLILGKATGWAMDTDLSAAYASFWGEDAYDNSGWSAAPAGNVNGDGFDDFLIGAWGNDDGAGQTYLLLGDNIAPKIPASPLCEGETNPTRVSDATPEFSWIFSDPDSGDTQSAYQILVASSSTNLAANNGNMWDSGKVISSASIDISYAGSTLSPGNTHYWKVKTWDNHDNEGPYCSEQTFTMNKAPNAPVSPLCEGETNPTGVSDATPEFSWTFSGPDIVDTQFAYQILVASSSANLAAGNGNMWDSGKVTSSASTDISYAGSTLSPGNTYYWKVKTWDNHDNEGPYCSKQTFTMNKAPNAPVFLRCERETNPSGVSDATPEFSWIFSDPDSGDSQSAYQILVASSSVNLAANNGDMWDSGKVTSSTFTDISYAGSTLSWQDSYYWKVKTWDNHGGEGSYCSEQTFTMSASPAPGGLSGLAIVGIVILSCTALAAIFFAVWKWRRRR